MASSHFYRNTYKVYVCVYIMLNSKTHLLTGVLIIIAQMLFTIRFPEHSLIVLLITLLLIMINGLYHILYITLISRRRLLKLLDEFNKMLTKEEDDKDGK